MIKLSKLSNFCSSEKEKLYQGLALVNYALKDDKFLCIYRGLTFDFTNDTTLEVLANVSKDGTVSSLDIEMLSWWSNHVEKTIAYEEDNQIVFNRYFFDDETIPAVANTIFHEWTHACGYMHASSTDYDSVPYKSGNQLEAFLEDMSDPQFTAYLAAAIAAFPADSSPAQPVSETVTTS